MVVVSISETYDLSTKVDKMTLIGIHTPVKTLIQKTYPGLCMNYKYFRILKVDCTLATAQQLPLSVGEIGLDTGKIKPQDIMNPILYKAVSNDSWSTLEARLMGLLYQPTTDIEGNMAHAEADNVTGLTDEHSVYYSLLANHDGFRTTPVQAGVTMRGLVPLVFDQWYTFGENGKNTNSDSAPGLDQAVGGTGISLDNLYSYHMRGRPHPMPKLNTTYLTGSGLDSESRGTHWMDNGMGVAGGIAGGVPRNYQIQMPDVPPVMLGCIILPPATATTGIIYYRMVCRAYIEFTDARPIQEITSFSQMDSGYAPLVYHSDYAEQSSKMDATTDMVDVKNAEIEKIMEGR